MHRSSAAVSRLSEPDDSKDDEQRQAPQRARHIVRDGKISELELPSSEEPVLDYPASVGLEAALNEAMETPLPLPKFSAIQASTTRPHITEVGASTEIPEIPELPELSIAKSLKPAKTSLSISISSASSDPAPPISLLIEKPYCLLGSSYLDVEEEDIRSSSSTLAENPRFNYPPLDSSATTSEFGFEPTCNLMPGSWLAGDGNPSPQEEVEIGIYEREWKTWKDILSPFLPLAPSPAALPETRISIRNESPNASAPETSLSLVKQKARSPFSSRPESHCSSGSCRPFSPFSSSSPPIITGSSNNLHLRGGGDDPPPRFSLFRRWGTGKKLVGNAEHGRQLLDQRISTTNGYFVGGWGQNETWREFCVKMEGRAEKRREVENEEENEISRWQAFVLCLEVMIKGAKKRAELVDAEVEVVGAEE
jgi:hypothetical protein